MEEVKTGYIVEYKNEPAKVISVLVNTCVIQVNDHRKTVRLSEVRILSRDYNTDVRTLQVCKKCNQIKLPDEFSRQRGNKLRNICTECWGKNISEKKAQKADKAGQSETEHDMKQQDNVNSPQHYVGSNGIEVKDVLEGFVKSLTGITAHRWCSAVEYLLRAYEKNGVEDLKKAVKNINWLIEEK
ncbi:DUF3310 domain-containing protein [Facklamia sp. 252]|uniref:DUF3310 domain-containing protein n=2 Tax=Lactobacillales TaxID=186826 RepID=UPI0031FE9869